MKARRLPGLLARAEGFHQSQTFHRINRWARPYMRPPAPPREGEVLRDALLPPIHNQFTISVMALERRV